MKLLLAHDGSAHSDAMIADLPRCGLPAAGSAVVFSVADAWTAVEGDAAPSMSSGSAGSSQLLRAALQDARRISEEGRQAVASRLPGWTVQAEAVAGSPAWEIIRKAEEWAPDLTMLGATGTSRLERLVFGTTTSQVIGHVRATVRACRPVAGASGPVRILLGNDGSENAATAARRIAERSWPEGSEVRVLTAVDSWLIGALEDSGAADAESRAQALPGETAPMLRAAGLTVSTETKSGDPKKLLPAEAKAWNADCIFVGARGRTGLARLLLGSVALATATRAGCSVEIVRP